MTLKEQILFRIDEKVEGEKHLEKKRIKSKKKKVVETVKLKKFLNDLLLEAIDLDNVENVIKSIQRGQISGVRSKVFFNLNDIEVEKVLNKTISKLKSVMPQNANFNSFFILLLKKFQSVENINRNFNSIQDLSDSMVSYFGNRNKKEVKQEEETKKRFEEYFNSPFDLIKDKEFEQWANDKFAQKAKAKDEDIEVIYDDGEWSVSIPKTFAAASKLACMNSRKTKWCTAANKKMFDFYSSGGNSLFVIRNEKKDIMIQMDWGGGSDANFKNEADNPIKIREFLKLQLPQNLLKSIKNKDSSKTLYDYFKKISSLSFGSEDKAKEMSAATKWKVTSINVDEIIGKLKSKKQIRFNLGGFEGKDFEKALSGKISLDKEIGSRSKAFEMTNGDGRKIYGIIGEVWYLINRKGKETYIKYKNAFLEIINGEGKIVDKGEIIDGNDSGIPDSLKKEIFGKDLSELKGRKIEQDGENISVINDVDLLYQRRDLFDEKIKFERFKRLIEDLHDGTSEIMIVKKNGGVLALWGDGEAVPTCVFLDGRKIESVKSEKALFDALKDLPAEDSLKIINKFFKSESHKKILSSTLIDKNFIDVPLLGGKYFHNLSKKVFLDKDKKELGNYVKLKKMLDKDELENLQKEKMLMDKISISASEEIEGVKFGYVGDIKLSRIRSDKELYKKKIEEYVSRQKQLKSEVVDQMINGKSNKILLKTLDMKVSGRGLPGGITDLEMDLFYDENRGRNNSKFYYVSKTPPYYSFGHLTGVIPIRYKPTIIDKTGKEESLGVEVRAGEVGERFAAESAMRYVVSFEGLLDYLKMNG